MPAPNESGRRRAGVETKEVRSKRSRHREDGNRPQPHGPNRLAARELPCRNPLRRQQHFPDILSVLNEMMGRGGVIKAECPSNLRLDRALLP